MKHYKKPTLYALLLCSLMPVACENGLQEESYSVFDETTLTKPENGLQGVRGVYSALRDNGGNGYYAGYLHQLTEYPSDIVTTKPDSRQGIQLDQLTYDASNSIINDVWTSIFRLISRANESEYLIGKIDYVGNGESDEVKMQHLAEVRFLRALAYYDATSLWGDVPLNLKSSAEFVEADENPPLVAQSTIEEQIIIDLEFAEQYLPSSYPVEQNGRATQGAAQGLLARLYMRQGEWQKAADKCATIITGGIYDLRASSEGGVVALFDNMNRSDNEFIFVMKSSSEPGSYGILSNSFGIQSVPWDYNRGWGNFPIHREFYAEFSPQDQRRQLLLGTYKALYGQIVTLPKEFGGEGGSLPDTIQAQYTYGLKYPHTNNYNYAGYNNVSIIRYSDILLMRAEALNELNGPNNESISLINEIRERSNASSVDVSNFSSTEALRDFIFEERGLELFMEGRRRDDLIRWGRSATNGADPLLKFKERVRPLLRDQNTYSDAVNYALFPYPIQEIQANTSLNVGINQGRVRQ
ncbi:RagB/SusD family nutrient uptake outer membrane protein [Parapedobacter koreensis]|uniref:Starch-binding associating with outer membrane n=1 Tax=Parapedobacter koreensis TaxID=332977 RepID=A0A1H7S5W1_9SPHI|nr:RagB/SusD family nutrient uptake outer membrane protein [Parapedobacter koreensis]SEL67679.1 Starch-binding associating with outer membrane [Parapedobacter koreensis]